MSCERRREASVPVSKGPATASYDALATATSVLRDAGVENPARDLREILASVLEVTPAEAWLQRDRIADPDIAGAIDGAVQRRAAGEPLAYVTGRAGFRYLELGVDRRALIPRTETEGLVAAVLAWSRARAEPPRWALDLGTGSGCIALALAVEGKFERIVATDISDGALEVARANGSRLGLTVDWRQGSWLDPISGERFSVIVSNPPYIPEAEYHALDASVREFEPRVALESGPDGFEAISRILSHAGAFLEPGGLLALEIDARSTIPVTDLATASGWTRVRIERDLFDRPRYLFANKES